MVQNTFLRLILNTFKTRLNVLWLVRFVVFQRSLMLTKSVFIWSKNTVKMYKITALIWKTNSLYCLTLYILCILAEQKY